MGNAPTILYSLHEEIDHMVEQTTGVSRFELRLRAGPIEEWPSSLGQTEIHPQIFLDGQHLDEPHLVHLQVLIDSLHREGQADIFTCTCGEAGCTGIYEGVEVVHDAGLVRWKFRRPQSASGFADLDTWRASTTTLRRTFEREQMLSAVQRFLQDAKSLVGPDPDRFCWPVYGFCVSDLLTIDPSRPFYDRVSVG